MDVRPRAGRPRHVSYLLTAGLADRPVLRARPARRNRLERIWYQAFRAGRPVRSARVAVVATSAGVIGPPAAVRYGGPGGLLGPPGAGTFGMPGPYVYDAASARKVPAVGRALGLYAGLTKQLPIDAVRGYAPVPNPPRICDRPDPFEARSWFVQVSVEDYLLSGNAISRVTVRGFDGWPLAVEWLPAAWTSIVWTPGVSVRYYYLGVEIPAQDVIHVKRGADRLYPKRGVGVVEEYLSTLDRVAMEEEYERGALSGGAVPSVAVITPQSSVPQEVADDAKAAWLTKFSGPQREPVILPNGTQVIPLAWSPTDTQLTEARRLSLLDVANMWNLDGYWLGAPVAGLTYKSASPQYQQILKTSLEPVLSDFEDVWSYAWLPRGTSIRFRRSKLLQDDVAALAAPVASLVAGGIITREEARGDLGKPPTPVPGLGELPDELPAAPTAPAELEPVPADNGGTPA